MYAYNLTQLITTKALLTRERKKYSNDYCECIKPLWCYWIKANEYHRMTVITVSIFNVTYHRPFVVNLRTNTNPL